MRMKKKNYNNFRVGNLRGWRQQIQTILIGFPINFSHSVLKDLCLIL